MVAVMLEASVPPRAAKPLAREGVTLAQIQQFGVDWAAGILLEKHVVLSQKQLQQVVAVAPAAAHGSPPPSQQVPPQPRQGNDADQRVPRPQRVVKRWFSAACATLGCKCKASWNGAPGQKCCKRCAPEHHTGGSISSSTRATM